MNNFEENHSLPHLSDFIINHESHAIYKIAITLVKGQGEINMALCTRLLEGLKDLNRNSLNNLYLPEMEEIEKHIPNQFKNIITSNYATFISSISPANFLSKVLTTPDRDVCKAINFIGSNNPAPSLLMAHGAFIRKVTNIVSSEEFFPTQFQSNPILITSTQKHILAAIAAHYVHFPIELNTDKVEIHKPFIRSIWEEAVTTETDINHFAGGVNAWHAKKILEVSKLFEANINLIAYIFQQIKTPPSSSFLAGFVLQQVRQEDFDAEIMLAQLKQLPKTDLPLIKAAISKAVLDKSPKEEQVQTHLFELANLLHESGVSVLEL